MVAHKILKDHANALAQLVGVVLAQVDAVEQNLSFGRVVQACEQLDQRGFARAILAYQRQLLARRDFQAHIAQRPVVTAGVAKPDVAELQPTLQFTRHRHRRGVHRHLRREAQEGEQVVHKQPVLKQAVHIVEQALEGTLAVAEQRQVEGHKTQRDLAARRQKDDPGVGAIVAGRGEHAPQQADQRTAARQVLVFLKNLPEHVGVALQQRLAQAKQFDFLHRVVDGQDVLKVVHAARLGRAPCEQAEL